MSISVWTQNLILLFGICIADPTYGYGTREKCYDSCDEDPDYYCSWRYYNLQFHLKTTQPTI